MSGFDHFRSHIVSCAPNWTPGHINTRFNDYAADGSGWAHMAEQFVDDCSAQQRLFDQVVARLDRFYHLMSLHCAIMRSLHTITAWSWLLSGSIILEEMCVFHFACHVRVWILERRFWATVINKYCDCIDCTQLDQKQTHKNWKKTPEKRKQDKRVVNAYGHWNVYENRAATLLPEVHKRLQYGQRNSDNRLQWWKR